MGTTTRATIARGAWGALGAAALAAAPLGACMKKSGAPRADVKGSIQNTAPSSLFAGIKAGMDSNGVHDEKRRAGQAWVVLCDASNWSKPDKIDRVPKMVALVTASLNVWNRAIVEKHKDWFGSWTPPKGMEGAQPPNGLKPFTVHVEVLDATQCARRNVGASQAAYENPNILKIHMPFDNDSYTSWAEADARKRLQNDAFEKTRMELLVKSVDIDQKIIELGYIGDGGLVSGRSGLVQMPEDVADNTTFMRRFHFSVGLALGLGPSHRTLGRLEGVLPADEESRVGDSIMDMPYNRREDLETARRKYLPLPKFEQFLWEQTTPDDKATVQALYEGYKLVLAKKETEPKFQCPEGYVTIATHYAWDANAWAEFRKGRGSSLLRCEPGSRGGAAWDGGGLESASVFSGTTGATGGVDSPPPPGPPGGGVGPGPGAAPGPSASNGLPKGQDWTKPSAESPRQCL